MRQAARTKGSRQQVSNTVSLPSPVGGWNARDSLADMPTADAVSLENWFPMTTECVLRYGSSNHVTGISSAVESLMEYSGATTSKMFAASGTSFYDVTSAGAVGAAVVTGLSNARWNHINITTSGGSFMYCANGVDKPRLYDGATWTAIDGASTPAITGVTTTTLKNPIVHKNRLWFIQTNTLKTWYLPTSSVGGAAAVIDLSAVAQKGGYLVSHCTWTIDAGTGVDDYYLAVTSNGEVIVYQGTDPTSANTWALKGVWQMGSPVGDRCLTKFAGDVLYISQDGLIPISGALQSSRVNPKVALTDKIQSAISQAVTSYGSSYGWDVMYFPRENQLWLLVPATTPEVWAMNTITKAWTKYTGWTAYSLCLFNDTPYFGSTSEVVQAWTGNNDNSASITATALQAFDHFKQPGRLKRFTMMRPIFRSSGAPAVYGAINIDFDTAASNALLSFSASSSAAGDSAVWDSAIWGGELSVIQEWQGVTGFGYYGAPQIRATAMDIDVRWVSTDIVMETGGVV